MSYDLHVQNTEGPKEWKEAAERAVASAKKGFEKFVNSPDRGQLSNQELNIPLAQNFQTPSPIVEARRQTYTPLTEDGLEADADEKRYDTNNDGVATKLFPIDKSDEKNETDPGTPQIFTNSNVLAKRGTFIPTSFITIPSKKRSIDPLFTFYNMLAKIIVYYHHDDSLLHGPFVFDKTSSMPKDNMSYIRLEFKPANGDEDTLLTIFMTTFDAIDFAHVWNVKTKKYGPEFVTLLIPDCKTIDNM